MRDFPLVFKSGARPQTDFRSQHHGIEGLCRDNPEPTVEMNTADAQARGIDTGRRWNAKELTELIGARPRRIVL